MEELIAKRYVKALLEVIPENPERGLQSILSTLSIFLVIRRVLEIF